MATFTVELVPDFATRQRIYKLRRNGKCMVDEFRKDIMADSNLAPELLNLDAALMNVANGLPVPPSHYKKLHTGEKLKYAIFEVKSRHLRLYLFQEKETGQIMIVGGKKVRQKKDIARVIEIVKDYTLFKQQK